MEPRKYNECCSHFQCKIHIHYPAIPQIALWVKETLQKYQWNKLLSPVIKISRTGNSCLPLFLTSLHEIWQNFSGLSKVSGWWWSRAGPSVVVLVLQAAVCTTRIGFCGFTVGEYQSAGETQEGLITFRTFPFSLPTQVMRMCFCACGCMCT